MIYVGHHFYAVQIQDRWPLNAFEYERVAVQPSVDESKFTGYSIGCWDNDIVNIQFGSIAYTRIVCRGSSVYWELVFQGICIRIITEYIPKFEIVYTRFYCRIKWIEKFREIIVINHGRRCMPPCIWQLLLQPGVAFSFQFLLWNLWQDLKVH